VKIALFGLFGQGNIGNDCTLQAVIYNTQKHLPESELFVVCTNPEKVSKMYGLPSVAISGQRENVRPRSTRPNILQKLARGFLHRLPLEFKSWCQAFRALKGTRMLLMTGTGVLTDWASSAWGHPYSVFKWTVSARLRRCQVKFLSVGVGPLNSRLSRYFVKTSLRLADYRSYRDNVSKERLMAAGFENSNDSVVPDLAFSLPQLIVPAHQQNGRPVVGLGIMDYKGQRTGQANGQAVYQKYVEDTAKLAGWLIDNGYRVRVLYGDTVYDQQPRKDLREALKARRTAYEKADIIDEDISDVAGLLAQLAKTDLVISPRFHNQLLALSLGKPVISVSYDPKSDALLQSVGLGQFCQPIEELNMDKLIKQFSDLHSEFENLRPVVLKRVAECRSELDQQYRVIFS
jgi:polysaccharide pyruvyl transferase WcaK-like protein